MSALRVLELLGPSTGGIRRHVAALRDHLQAQGWDVTLAGPAGVLPELDHVVPVPGGADPRAILASRRALVSLLDDVDLVHAHGLKAGWVAASVRRRPPLVVSVHNLVLDEAAGRAAPLLRWAEGKLPGRADATIAVSRGVADRFAGVAGADRIVVIPPAGPIPRPERSPEQVRSELGIAETDDLVVTPARLHPQKGLDVLLDAAARLVAERPQLRWFVFGEGPLRAQLEREVHDRDLDGVVHLAGMRPDVDSELAAADVVAITSNWESGPLVVLEALALGRPVVSTRVGLAPDVIRPPHGRLVDVGDAAGLAAAIDDLLSGALLVPGVDLAGSSTTFGPGALAAEVEALYRKVLASR